MAYTSEEYAEMAIKANEEGKVLVDNNGVLELHEKEEREAGEAGKSILFGVDQTWQNMAGQRKIGVTYTNTTGKPIVINVLISAKGTNVIYIIIDGVSMPVSWSYNPSLERGAHIVIPAGSTYRLTQGGLWSWWELR